MNKSVDDIVSSVEVSAPAYNYSEFIHEVFIAPIRTAVVVDDEFPTLDEFLTDQASANAKKQSLRAKEIIEFCRNRKPFPWIVDVHDGRNISLSEERESATHFDHTDLLVLDYHLDGEQQGGDLAVGLLKRLAKNEHFNLVIIYTNSDVSSTLREIALSLCFNSRVVEFLDAIKDKWVEKIYQGWVDEDEDFVGLLHNSIDDLAFIKAVNNVALTLSDVLLLDEFSAFDSLLDSKPGNYKKEKMLGLFLRVHYGKNKGRLSSVDFGDVLLDENIQRGEVDDINWLRVDSLFLTVVKKSVVSPEQFTNRLQIAIEAWDPSPHRLIITKMRSEMSRRGVMVEKEVLQNPYLQAAWLTDLFEENKLARRTNVTKNVAKHWGSLGGRVEAEVLKFAEKVCEYLVVDNVKLPRFHNPVYLNQSMMALHVNQSVCSKRVEGHHLFTGHVIRFRDELWVCLTPACDLEPDRNIGRGSNKNLGRWIPFKAAKIEKLTDHKSALMNAARGHHLFLSIDGGDPAAYTFSPGIDQSILPTLKWQQFYAAEQGVFNDSDFTLKVATSIATEESLEFVEGVADVVAELRYEYALHLIQRLGSHLTRVGLDFISHS